MKISQGVNITTHSYCIQDRKMAIVCFNKKAVLTQGFGRHALWVNPSKIRGMDGVFRGLAGLLLGISGVNPKS